MEEDSSEEGSQVGSRSLGTDPDLVDFMVEVLDRLATSLEKLCELQESQISKKSSQ